MNALPVLSAPVPVRLRMLQASGPFGNCVGVPLLCDQRECLDCCKPHAPIRVLQAGSHRGDRTFVSFMYMLRERIHCSVTLFPFVMLH